MTKERLEEGEARSLSNAPQQPERTLERALGLQIRQLRRQNDLSVSDLAAASNISTGMLSKIENGGISASLSTLQSIAGALNVPLSSLFSSFEERQDCSYVPAEKGVAIERRGSKSGHAYQLLGHVLNGDVVVEPYLISLSENAHPHTGFRHGGVEMIYMLEGSVSYRHGAESYTLTEGDTLLFDSSALHGPESLITPSSRYLSIIVYPRSSG
ncbi:helix-turn-helix domain-containing protein [Sphingomonas montanisoli]|uniref:Helix-turn-helix domain-containing protein n=1 Tax=Sphingomonas montanisoli TaxID=2606412 RepID=A0A5D9CBG4_9SPHN|nr:XRE family transcriptional regulator [Sphingomonas montanisoli]TZG27405.1 helix-turn-helix domain-containing protein [Sphingomonas montanisoli]